MGAGRARHTGRESRTLREMWDVRQRGEMRFDLRDDGGSHRHVEWSTRPVRLRHEVVITLLHHTMNP